MHVYAFSPGDNLIQRTQRISDDVYVHSRKKEKRKESYSVNVLLKNNEII